MTSLKFVAIIVFSVVLCFTASTSSISGEPPPSGDTTIKMRSEIINEGVSNSGTNYINRWKDKDMDGEIRYEEETNATYGTTHRVKTFNANNKNGNYLDADTNTTFVADPDGGNLVSNEKAGLQVLKRNCDDPSGTPSEGDLYSLCPWRQDPGKALGKDHEIPACDKAVMGVETGSDMNVSIVKANKAATVGATGSERNVSYGIAATGPQETGGYGAGTISAGMDVVSLKTTNPAKSTSASQVEYQADQDSMTSSGVWIFSKEMDYIDE